MKLFLDLPAKANKTEKIKVPRERAVWWKTKSSVEKYVVDSCVWESPIEIVSITQNRIEGRVFTAPSGAKLDRKKCSWAEKPKWQDFAWVLE